jgi:hypothetical protein
MLQYWRERRVRKRLMMRELFLRLEEERLSVSGRSGVPTEYFREQKRRLLLRNPRFAIQYHRARRKVRTTVKPRVQDHLHDQYLDLLKRGADARRRLTEENP